MKCKTIAEDFEGISYWVGVLDAGTARGTAVASLINAIQLYAPGGAYYDPYDVVTVAAYNQFQNRVAVEVSISQNGCAASFQDSYGIWGTGTISGNHLTVHSSWYEAGGQVNAVYNATVSNDKQSLQGSGTWSDGQFTCHPSSSISGSLIHQ
jgi:hypothetical protein